MGKSALLTALGSRAADAGLRVLAGRVGEFERTIPFGVLVDALDNHVTDWTADRDTLHRTTRGLLADLAEDSGLVLLLDDLHWADDGSIDLIGYLVRHPPAAAVLLACAYRPRQLAQRLRERLDHSALVERLELAPLDLADAAALLGLSTAACQSLHEASGGNPFYLEALALRGRTVETGSREGTPELPPAIRAALEGELDGLAPGTRRVLQIAAVTADPCEPEMLAEVAGITIEETLGCLDELASADLVRPAADLRSYHFRHPIVRNISYHSATASLRHNAHSRAAAVLERYGAPPEIRAHHVERAAQRGDAAAAAVLTSAARNVVGTAPGTAAQWFASALALTAGPADSAQRLELSWGRARALGLSGQLTASRQVLHDLLAAMPRSHPERMDAVAFCAHIERTLGRHAEVRALAGRELAAMDDQDTVPAAVLKLVLAVSLVQVLESPAVIGRLIDEVLATADRHASPLLGAGARGVAAMLELDGGNIERHLTHLRSAAEAVDGATDGAIAERLECVGWLSWSELRLGRYREALRHYERTLAVARSTGQLLTHANLLLGRANSLRWLGWLDDAAVSAEDAVEAAFLGGSTDVQAITLADHSWIRTLRGDTDAGLALARRAVDVARSVEGWYRTYAQVRVGHACVAAGDFAVALLELQDAGLDRSMSRVPLPYRAEMCELMVQATLGCGRPTDAAGWAELASTTAAGLGLACCVGFAELATAAVCVARGELVKAVERANAAVGLFDSVGARMEVGRARLLSGRALAAQGNEADAVAELRHARTLFATCGAHGLDAEAGAALEKLGTADREPPAGLDSLTKRELQVAELVGKGMTNRQVARRLQMAEKTVEGHLSRIFDKLSVPSRAALANLIASAKQ